ncbi:MAG TPA: hypothetical protein VGP76_21750 [Planctomycetaceae bacterium]|nr:hypothetical protein [Planctomycetaceae bacterium]
MRDAFIRNLDRVVALGKLPRMFNLHWENTRRAEAEARGQGPRVITSGPPIEWQPWPVHAVQLEPRPFSVDFLFGKVPIGSRFAVEGLMASMLIGTWTAFETLASDLWEEALNCHPQALAALSGDPSSWQNDNSSEGKRDEQKSGGGSGDKSLSLGLIQGHITDLFQQLGTLLRYRYSFQTLPVIRKAYGQAFSKDFEEIRGILVDTSFDHLAGTRNILVHRAGKADSKFQSQTRDCAHFSQIQDGDLVVLNGIIVADIMSKAITQAVKLLIAVDKWICDHPQDV